MLPPHLITNNTPLPKHLVDALMNPEENTTTQCPLDAKATTILNQKNLHDAKATTISTENGFVEDSGIQNKFPCMYLLDMERRRKIAPFWFRRARRLRPETSASIIPFLP